MSITRSATNRAGLPIMFNKERCRTNNVGFIEGWYVKPEYRQKGIGKLLVRKAESWAISKGCREMDSDTNERYPISPIAHKALGYKEVDTPLNYKKSLIGKRKKIDGNIK